MLWNYIIEIKVDKSFNLYIDNQLMKLDEVVLDCKGDKIRAYPIITDDRRLLHAIFITVKNSDLYLIANIKEYHKEDNKIYGTIEDDEYPICNIYYTDNVQRSSPDGGVELQANGRGKILDLYDQHRYDI